MGIERASSSRGCAIALLAWAAFVLAAVPAAAQGVPVPPGVPRSVKATAGNGELTLTWQAPTSWGSFTASEYEIDWRIGNSGDWIQLQSQSTGLVRLPATATSYTFTGNYRTAVLNGVNQYHTVTNGTTYQFRIRAVSVNPGDPADTSVGNWVTVSGTPQAAPVLSINSPSVAEGDSGTANLAFVVSLSGSTSQQVTVAYADTGTGTATSGTDYTAVTAGTLTFAAGDSTKTVTVTVTGDTVDEPNETVVLRLSSPSNATLTGGVTELDGTGTITDDDAAQSSNANLSGLTASTATSSTGTYAALTLAPSTFSASTTSYTATVANARTHAKLTPTVQDTGKATVTVQGTSVNSGSASGAIALSVGTNTLTVRVTAQDSTTKNYTVTITRQAAQSSNANLSGLAASTATSSTGTYAALTLAPSTFSASTTSYTATVANARTHAKLTPTVQDTGKATVTVQGTPVNSGSASSAIALSVGANALTVRVTAQDSTTKNYTVTITRQAQATAPAPPTGLTVTAGDAQLTARWTAPTGVDVSRYEVQIKLKSAPNWPGTDTDVTGTSHTFPSLSNGSTYQVRVRTVEVGETTPSGWTAPAEGTPQAPSATPAVSLSASPNPVPEGSAVTVTARLSAALSAGITIPLRLTDDSAEPDDHGTLASITITSGSTSGTGRISTSQDADEDDERFTVALDTANLPSSVTAGSPKSVVITINDDDDPPGAEPTGAFGAIELPPGPLKLALWTDGAGYRPGEPLRLYRSIDPRRLADEYAVLLYLERVGSAERRYLAPLSGSQALRAEPVDQYGLSEGSFRVASLAEVERELSWQGPAPLEPGLWQFVLELRPGGSPVALHRIWAKFAVGPGRVLNRPGFERAVTAELTLRGGRVHYLLDRLVVRDGATLRLEPGALVRAYGDRAEIVVEPGGRIEASGTRQMPVVLTCTLKPGERMPGCWAGLRIHGRAPVTGGGGDDADDSSGWLRHVRVEFAGADPEEGAAAPALTLRGVGSGTALEHVQARSSAGDGIVFVGGTAACEHCVASASEGDGIAWQDGFRGHLRHLHVWQGGGEGDAIDGSNLASGPDREPRSHPVLANVTLATGGSGSGWSKGAALRLRAGTALTARQLLIRGFRGGAVVAGPRSGQLLEDRASGVTDSIQYGNLGGWRGDGVELLIRPPLLRNAGTDPNHDARPKQLFEARGDPPGEADYIGAFGEDNWLEEWTVFGLEADYAPQQ